MLHKFNDNLSKIADLNAKNINKINIRYLVRTLLTNTSNSTRDIKREEKRMDKKSIEQKIEAGFVAAVVVDYDYSNKKRGDVISCHRSYEAANRKASTSTMWAVKYLTDMINQ